MSNPFPANTRPWLRISNAKRALSDLILSRGDFAITETGKQYNGDGVTPLKNLPALGTGSGGGLTVVDNGDGTLSSTSGIVDNGDGTLTA